MIRVTMGSYHLARLSRIMVQMGASVEFDDALDALGDTRRRELLLTLLERGSYDDSPVVVDGSGSGLAAVEDGVAMRHIHLPKLADHGLVRWDRATHEVQRGPDFVEIRPMLELLDEHADELPEGWS